MVLEGVVSTLLNEYLGSFLEGLDASQLRLHVWSGRVHLRGLNIRPSAFDDLGLPLTVVSGSVESLRLEANWRSLTSQPVRVELEGVHVLLAPRGASPAQTAADADAAAAAAAARAVESKLRSLAAVEEFRLQAEGEAAKAASSTRSYLQRLQETVLDNVQLSIRDVHIRFACDAADASGGGRSAVVGVGVEELSAFSTNEDGAHEFTAAAAISHRRVELRNLCAYLHEEDAEVEAEAEAGREAPALRDVLEAASTRFVLAPLSASLSMVHHKDEAASPRIAVSSTLEAIALSVDQRQYRHALHALSALSSAQRSLSSALSSSSAASASEPELSKEQRRRYVQLYKRTLNALWQAELSEDERAELDQLDRSASYASLSRARTLAFHELKKELQGRTVMTRQAAKDEAARSAKGGLLKGWFGTRQSAPPVLPHDELTEQQRDDLDALLEDEEKADDGRTPSAAAGDGVLLQVELGLRALSVSLLDAEAQPMLRVTAEGGSASLVKRPRGLLLEVGLQSLRCTESLLQDSHYAELLSMEPSDDAAASDPPPFLRAAYEDPQGEPASGRRLSLQLSSPVVRLHRPLLCALLTFFAVPAAVDLATFSAWSLQQLEALRSFSTATLAEALLSHSAIDLSIDLTAPVFVVALDPRAPPPAGEAADVMVVNLGRLSVTTELSAQDDVRGALERVQRAKGIEELDEATLGRLYDHYCVVVSRTSVLLSSKGPAWPTDPRPSYLLEPLDLRLDVQSAISRDVDALPNVRVQGRLERLQLHVSDRKVRRLARFIDAFSDLDSGVPREVRATLIARAPESDRQRPPPPPPRAAAESDGDPTAIAIGSSASHPSTTAITTSSPYSSSFSSSPSSPRASFDADELTALFHGDRAKARAVLKELDVDGSGEVDSEEVVAWERRRLLSRAHRRLLQLSFAVGRTTLSIEREAEAGDAEVMLSAEVGGVAVRLLKETFVTRLSLRVAELSATERSDSAPPRLLLDTRAAEGAGQGAGQGAVADSAASPASAGFVNVELEHRSTDSPDFPQERTESLVDVRVGELRLFVDVASAYRLGAFLLFELLPAAAPPAKSGSDRASSASVKAVALLSASTSTAGSPTSPSPRSPGPSLSERRPREYQRRLTLTAAFDRLRVSLLVGGARVSEVDVLGLRCGYTQLLHSVDATARLRSVAVRDCTAQGRLYPEVVRSLAASATSPATAVGDSAADRPLIEVEYSTFSPLDDAPPPHAAAVTARLRGLQFVLLRRFVDEQLALLLTGPVARLLKENQKRNAVRSRSVGRVAQQRPGSERRRSSLPAALLSPASLEALDGDVAPSPLSARRFLLLDVRLEDVACIVPYHSSSEHHVATSFASVALSNAVVREEGAAERARLSVGFSAFTVRSSLLVAGRRREANIVDLSAVTLRVDSCEAERRIDVRLQPGDVVCALTPSQVQLLAGVASANMQEKASSRSLLQQQSDALSPLPPRPSSSVPSSSAKSNASASLSAAVSAVAAAAPARGATPSAGPASKASPPSLPSPPAAASPSSPHLHPVVASSAPPTVTLTGSVPTFSLDLFDDAAYTPDPVASGDEQRAGERWLLSLAIRSVSASLALHPDGSLQAEAAVEAVSAIDRSVEGATVSGRAVLEQRKRILSIEAPTAASASAASPDPPLRLSVVRTVDASNGAQRSAVDVRLASLRFSMAAVLLRLGSFLPTAAAAPPPAVPIAALAALPGGGGAEELEERGGEEELDFSLLSQAEEDGPDSASAAPPTPPPAPPSSLSLHVRMARPTFALVADPTASVSPAVLLTWSASLDVERTREDGRERLTVSGALQRVSCVVTELDADNAEWRSDAAAEDSGGREAAVILPPFNAAVEAALFVEPRHSTSASPSSAVELPALPRRFARVTVEPIVLRLSYSSYRLLSSTVSALLLQQPRAFPAPPSSSLQSAAVAGSEADADSGAALLDEFALTDTAGSEASQPLPLFSEDDVTVSVQSVHALLINDCLTSELPFARLSLDRVSGEVHAFAHHRHVRGSARLCCELWDHATATWAPLLEPYTLNAALSSSIALALHPPPPAAEAQPQQHSAHEEKAAAALTVRGSLSHWLQVTSAQPLNVNLSHSMVLGALDAAALLTQAQRRDQVTPAPPPARAPQDGGRSDAAGDVATALKGTASSPAPSTGATEVNAVQDFLPFLLENCTEFAMRCHGLYSRREQSTAPPQPSSASASAAASTEFGSWSVAPQSSLPFAFPEDASPVNQSLLIEIAAPAPLAFPALTVPFTRTSVECHRMPGRGPSAVVVVAEVYIREGIKVCRVRGRVGVSNRTSLTFEWSAAERGAGWPSLQPHSTFFFPLTAPLATARLALRPAYGGFEYCAPLTLQGALAEETVSRFTCARSGLATSSTPALSFSGDFHAVLCGRSLMDGLGMHGPVEDEVRRGRSAAARKRAQHDSDDDGDERGDGDSSGKFDARRVHSTVYSLRPPVVVENLLPRPVELRCLERSKERGDVVCAQHALAQGRRVALFGASASAASSLSFRLPALRQSQWSTALPLLGDRDAIERALQSATLHVSVKDDDKRELVVDAQYALQQGCVVLSLYVPYWLFDETDLGLLLSADRQRTVPLGRWEEFQRAMLSDERSAQPFSFPAAMQSRPAEERSVQLTTAAHFAGGQQGLPTAARGSGDGGASPPQWSAPFSIDAVGFRFSASIPGLRGADGLQPMHEVGISIQQGGGLFRRTRMVVCSPRLVLVNQLTVDVEARQHQCGRALRVTAGGVSAWQWPDSGQKRFLSVRRVGSAEVEGWEWSGVFNPAKVGLVHLLVRHASVRGRYFFLRAESRMQDSSVFCVLSAFPQEAAVLRSVLPYRVTNRALFHAVRFRQVKDGVSYGDWIVVEPQSAMPYCWEQPLLAGTVELQLGLHASLVGERWEERLTLGFDAAQGAPPLTRKLKPLPGDETRSEQRLFVHAELFGPTRVLLVSVFPSLEQMEEDIRAEARQQRKDGRISRRALNEALRVGQQCNLQGAIDRIDAQLSQLTVTRVKDEEKATGLASGMIERPHSVAPEESALLIRALGVHGVAAGTGVRVAVDFNGSSARTEPQRAGPQGSARFTAPQAAFRTTALRLSTVCRVSLLVSRGEAGEAEKSVGHLDLTLFEFDDHLQKQQRLPLLSPTSAAAANAEVELWVWWVPPAEEEVRKRIATIERVQAEWRRVRAALKAELRQVVRGRLEGVVGSAATEVLFLVRLAGLTGTETLMKAVPQAGGRVVVRVTSDLTGKVASAVLCHHSTDVRVALRAPPSVSQALPFLVSEDVLDARGGEVLHFEVVFVPAVSAASSALPPSVVLARASIPLNDVPVSHPEASKQSAEETVWSQRSFPLQPSMSAPSLSSSSSSSSSAAARTDLCLVATFRRYPARSDEQRPQLKLSLSLPSLGLSLINDVPEELLYFSLRNLSLSMEQAAALQTLFLKADSAQLDNQQPSAVFPVVLAPSHVAPEERQPLLQLSVTKQRGLRDRGAKAQYAVWAFPYLSLLVQGLDVRVEEALVWALLSYIDEFTRHDDEERQAQDAVGSGDARAVDAEVQRATVRRVSAVRLTSGSAQMLYFQFLQIQPLSFRISFLATPGMRARGSELRYNPLNVLLSAASSTLGSLDNAAIRLNGQIIENASGTVSVLLSSLRQFYQDEALSQAYKLVGSFDFLGNPSELLASLGTGVQDLFYEPAKGLVKSPSDFGRGVAKGSLSLLKNTFGGLLGAASRITGSMGKAAAFLSLDDNFAREQQQRSLQQPTSAVSGVVGGVQSLGMGVFRGVTGVVMDPLKGAQRGGVEGFLKGMGKGSYSRPPHPATAHRSPHPPSAHLTPASAFAVCAAALSQSALLGCSAQACRCVRRLHPWCVKLRGLPAPIRSERSLCALCVRVCVCVCVCALLCCQGLAGVIAKPTAGLIDLTSQTLRGVGNSVNDTAERTRLQRVRRRRAMGESGVLRPYDEEEAEEEDRRKQQQQQRQAKLAKGK